MPTAFSLARSSSLLDLHQTVLQPVELLATSFGTLGVLALPNQRVQTTDTT